MEDGELEANERELRFHRENVENVPLSNSARRTELWNLHPESNMSWKKSKAKSANTRRYQIPIVIKVVLATITSRNISRNSEPIIHSRAVPWNSPAISRSESIYDVLSDLRPVSDSDENEDPVGTLESGKKE